MKPCSFCGELKRYCWCGMHDEREHNTVTEPRRGRYGYPIIDAEFDEVSAESSLPMLRHDIRSGEGDETKVR